MSKNHVEERLAALEGQVSRLQGEIDALKQPKDWRSTIGMFANDPFMREVEEEGRKWREAERRKARRRLATTKQKSKR